MTAYEKLYKTNQRNIALLEQLRDTLIEMNREYKQIGLK